MAELSWGQLDMWQAMVARNSWIPIGAVRPVPAGTTVADLADELRYLMCRYPSMRTRLRFAGGGPPRQMVASAGEITMEVVEADQADPAEIAAGVRQRYEEAAYDVTRDWPVRMAAVTRDGRPVHAVLVLSHLATDGAGALVMIEEVAARRREPTRGMTALEQARWQRSPAGRRQNDAVLRHWERMLRTIPARRFPGPTDAHEPRYWRGTFASRAVPLAMRSIAGRTRTDPAVVLVSMYAAALAEVTKINPVVFRPMVNNRFRASLADVVCTVAQSGLCVLDVAGASFDEVLARARGATMSAYKYAYFDPAALDDLLARISRERGPDFSLSSFYNDRRLGGRDDADDRMGGGRDDDGRRAPTPEEIRAAHADTRFTWTDRCDTPGAELFVQVSDLPEAIEVTMEIDTHALAPHEAEGILGTMDTIAVENAT